MEGKPTNIKQQKRTRRFSKWNRRDTAIFFERLELYLSSGLAIDTALQLCRDGVKPNHGAAIDQLKIHTVSGSTLSSGLVKYVGLSPTLSGMIFHGETSGGLVTSVALARSSIEKQDELIKKCVSSLVYPCVIGGFCVVFVIGLMRGVMPQIVPMLTGLHTKLPFISRVMIFSSNIVAKYGLHGLVGSILSVNTFILVYKKKAKFKHFIQQCLSKVPLVGTLMNNYSIVVFLRSFGALIDCGLPMSNAFDSSVGTVSFEPVAKVLRSNIQGISSGLSLGNVMKSLPAPRYIGALASAGELSGTLGTSLLRAANILDRDIELSLKRMTSLIEPLMMICMGLIVGSIALSILMPIYDLSKTLQH